jgi:acetoin utilization deacetylase AcuC-like enzyme
MDVLLTSAIVACNAAGGTHHAFSNRGEGFCIFNDMAVAIRLALYHGWIAQAIVVDLDVHQGNGTAEIFRNDPNVYTLSVHGDSNYPWKTRVAGDADYALPDSCSQQLFLDTVRLSLRHAAERMDLSKPTLVMYQAGVDPLTADR